LQVDISGGDLEDLLFRRDFHIGSIPLTVPKMESLTKSAMVEG
jgi:hypothetical protein